MQFGKSLLCRYAVLGGLLIGALNLQAANISVSSWAPEYQGIDYATAFMDGTDYSVSYAVRIDTTAPGVSFYTTPAGGSLNTISETTTQFVQSSGVQVAINANFFAPCCDAFKEDKTVIGLSVSSGNVVSAPTSTAGNSNAALLISKTNLATIATTASNMDLSNVYNAVAGSAVIVRNGANVGAQSPDEGDPTHVNPRTDVGVSQDGRYVYFVVIDGRQTGYSIGTTIPETADILLAYGAYNAINLDGGGSTSLVRTDGMGGTIDVNQPSGGAERYDANHIGVYAQALVTPEPGTVGLMAAALIAAGLFRRRFLN